MSELPSVLEVGGVLPPVDYTQLDLPNWLIGNGEEQEQYADRFPRSDFLRHPEIFVPARITDYAVWFEGYLSYGGQASVVLSEAEVISWEGAAVTATQDFTLDGEYGSLARPVIALPGVKIGGTYGGMIYTLDGYRLVEVESGQVRDASSLKVPIYATPEFGRVPGIRNEFWRLYERSMQIALENAERDDEDVEERDDTPGDVRNRYRGYAEKMGIVSNSL